VEDPPSSQGLEVARPIGETDELAGARKVITGTSMEKGAHQNRYENLPQRGFVAQVSCHRFCR
jgi:hypothetical protein